MRLKESNLKAVNQPVKNLQGVNCGPVSFGGLIDQTEYYLQAQIPLIRLHDTNWPHPREVDYYTIFPNFDADPSDPANYSFQTTDRYIRECISTGAEILFRLGVSIEHAQDKFHVNPPADFDRFAEICLGIVRHYTEGWADGFVCDAIRYWEIWNEPDLKHGFGFLDRPSPTWGGSFDEFCQLYRKTALRLKVYNPALCVGGPAFARSNSSFSSRFLDFIDQSRTPMDFCSWHLYTASISQMRRHARALRERLDGMGYSHTLSILDEWDYVFPDKTTDKLFKPGTQELRAQAYTEMMQEQGAAFDAAFLTALQTEPVDEAAFFCASPGNLYSMFDLYGRPQKNYYAFRQFAETAQLGTLTGIWVPEETAGLYVLRTESDFRTALLLSNFSSRVAHFHPLSRPGMRQSVILTDALHTYQVQEGAEELDIPPYSVITIQYQ